MPCNLREGNGKTYSDKGSDVVWLAGSKADDGKRFCTLQIAARAKNGRIGKKRRGQPKMTIVFRGQGIRITAAEKKGWHPDVNVRFQPKAWYDTEMCEQYALCEVNEMTFEARAAGRESVALFDNLKGQTTERHKTNLRKRKCKRHLLPDTTTDLLQLIDDGVGVCTKNRMADGHDDWLSTDENLEKWTGKVCLIPSYTILYLLCHLMPSYACCCWQMAAWEKRVLITNLAAKAWESLCETFDFERAATRLGMNMTIDGSGDDKIRLQGVENYTFCDADGGATGEVSSDADSSDSGDSNDADEQFEGAVEGAAGFDDSSDDEDGGGSLSGGDDEEEEDDTAEYTTDVRAAEAPAGELQPAFCLPTFHIFFLTGWMIKEECPQLDSEADLNKLIGAAVPCAVRARFAGGNRLVHRRDAFARRDGPRPQALRDGELCRQVEVQGQQHGQAARRLRGNRAERGEVRQG